MRLEYFMRGPATQPTGGTAAEMLIEGKLLKSGRGPIDPLGPELRYRDHDYQLWLQRNEWFLYRGEQ